MSKWPINVKNFNGPISKTTLTHTVTLILDSYLLYLIDFMSQMKGDDKKLPFWWQRAVKIVLTILRSYLSWEFLNKTKNKKQTIKQNEKYGRNLFFFMTIVKIEVGSHISEVLPEESVCFQQFSGTIMNKYA